MQRHQVCECWGFGSPDHVYSDRSGKNFCPRASKPGVKAKFDATRKEFQDQRKACTKKTLDKCKSNSLLSTFLQDINMEPVTYTHPRAHDTVLDLVCRLLPEKKKHLSSHHITSSSIPTTITSIIYTTPSQ